MHPVRNNSIQHSNISATTALAVAKMRSDSGNNDVENSRGSTSTASDANNHRGSTSTTSDVENNRASTSTTSDADRYRCSTSTTSETNRSSVTTMSEADRNRSSASTNSNNRKENSGISATRNSDEVALSYQRPFRELGLASFATSSDGTVSVVDPFLEPELISTAGEGTLSPESDTTEQDHNDDAPRPGALTSQVISFRYPIWQGRGRARDRRSGVVYGSYGTVESGVSEAESSLLQVQHRYSMFPRFSIWLQRPWGRLDILGWVLLFFAVGGLVTWFLISVVPKWFEWDEGTKWL